VLLLDACAVYNVVILLVHLSAVLKQLNISWELFHHLVAQYCRQFSHLYQVVVISVQALNTGFIKKSATVSVTIQGMDIVIMENQ